MTGRVLSLHLGMGSGLPKPQVEALDLLAGFGALGDRHAGKDPDRALLVAGIAAYEKAKRAGILDLPFGALGENLPLLDLDLVEGPGAPSPPCAGAPLHGVVSPRGQADPGWGKPFWSSSPRSAGPVCSPQGPGQGLSQLGDLGKLPKLLYGGRGLYARVLV
jgi:hypothetical protein